MVADPDRLIDALLQTGLFELAVREDGLEVTLTVVETQLEKPQGDVKFLTK